jgi:patatin-like phospholipase/acyl hydrolase
MPDRYRILSLDGGGIRGILTSRLLERIESVCPGFLGSIDLFAGTSTGAILALALASGRTPGHISVLYRDHGSEIFEQTVFDALGDVDRIVRADYDNRALKERLAEEFGTMLLGDIERSVLVSAFDLDSGTPRNGLRSWKPKFFHNFVEPTDDREQLVVDVAMRSCAAPTYFPIYQGFVDGGVVANNPSMCALAQALNKATADRTPSKIVLLSLGTGANPRYLEADDDSWGYLQWAPNLLSIMFEGPSGIADYECAQILGSRYHRVNPVLSEPIGLDAIDRIPTLEQIAEQVDLADTQRWIEHYMLGV